MGGFVMQDSKETGEPSVHAYLLAANADASRGVPDAAAHRGAVDVGPQGVLPQDDLHGLDLVGLPKTPSGPLYRDAPAQHLGQLRHQQLEHDAGVGAVGLQRGNGHRELEGIAFASAGRLHGHPPHCTGRPAGRPNARPAVQPAPGSPPPTPPPAHGTYRGSQITTGMARAAFSWYAP